MKNLTKRVIGMLISSAMLLTSPVVYADEVTEFTEFTLPEYTVEAPSADFGVTNDELLLGYFENQLYDIEGGISTFAVAGSSSLTGDNKKIYDELFQDYKNIYSGLKDAYKKANAKRFTGEI